ncbi:hypothetical protein TRFO_02849 [Tritrichomonas foetus]|uniref:Uncharacterized protein n=1 Tax=Tritrichomonas foetus TaxID=1144522 RepID=A0A1J4L0P8_9EUKA|nr:hypothetical protein TRFO_02849 [Tritrichomonas foetus]|eukprot:OHT15524.1 hypothetical protein TRFO_02849 [Tritrichomonas foetus]
MDMHRSNVDTKILKDPYDDGFVPYILKLPKNATPKESSNLFKILLGHLTPQLPREIGIPILMVIRVLIRNPKIRDIFVSNGYIDQLPYKNRNYVNEIFFILDKVVQNCPEAFDEELTNKFASILTRSPQKSLSILCSYAQQFNDIDSDNPWPMIDILIQGSKYFTTPDLIYNYSSVLLYLCTQYSDYRQGRASHCWRIFRNIITTKTDIRSLQTCYNALAVISEFYDEGDVPVDSVKVHLKIAPEILDSVLSLLVAKATDSSIFCDHELLDLLLDLAKSNVKATLILMKAASNLKVANLILGEGEWLTMELPIFTDTLRLFLVIFSHDEIRKKIVSFSNFVPFLKVMASIKNSGVITILCTVLRRIHINQEMLDQMSLAGFLNDFIQVSLQLGDQVSLHSFLLLLDTLSKIGYTTEFIDACETVVQLVQSDKHLNQIASYVAADLCRYEECAKKMKEMKLDVFFSNHLDDPQINKGGQKFLRTLDKHEL